MALLARVGVATAGSEWDSRGGGGGVVQRALYRTHKASVEMDVSGAKMLFSSTNGSSICCAGVPGCDMTDDTREDTDDVTAGILVLQPESS